MEDLRVRRALLNACRIIAYRRGIPRPDALDTSHVLRDPEDGTWWMTVHGSDTTVVVNPSSVPISRDRLTARHTEDTRLMLVLNKDASSKAACAYDDAEIWTIDELQYDIAHHTLVPPHTIASDADVSSVLRRYSLRSRQQLPLISSRDPMARYVGLRPGDVVRITRVSKTVGQYDVYRCCVKSA